jgi:hypothetical protein
MGVAGGSRVCGARRISPGGVFWTCDLEARSLWGPGKRQGQWLPDCGEENVKQRPFLLTIAVLLSLVGSVWGQEAPPGLALADGIRQVEQGDLEAAVFTLDSVVRQLATQPRNERNLALAHLYLGMAHLGLSQLDRAREEMRSAWQSDHTLKLDPDQFPPRVIELYSEAVAAIRAAPLPPPPPGKTGGHGAGAPIIGLGALAAASAVGALTLASSPKPSPSNVPGSTPFLANGIDGQWDGIVDPNTGIREDLALAQTSGNAVVGFAYVEDLRHGIGPAVGTIQGFLSIPASGPPSITFDVVRSDINLAQRGTGTFDASLHVLTGHWVGGASWVFTRD